MGKFNASVDCYYAYVTSEWMSLPNNVRGLNLLLPSSSFSIKKGTLPYDSDYVVIDASEKEIVMVAAQIIREEITLLCCMEELRTYTATRYYLTDLLDKVFEYVKTPLVLTGPRGEVKTSRLPNGDIEEVKQVVVPIVDKQELAILVRRPSNAVDRPFERVDVVEWFEGKQCVTASHRSQVRVLPSVRFCLRYS